MSNLNIVEAIKIITDAGLTVTTSDGNIKAKAKKKITGRRSKGTGSIVYLGKKRSKPYGALITLGYDDETGKQVQKYIGYFKTREEAQKSLEQHNTKTEHKEDIKTPTVKEIWDKVVEKDLTHLNEKTIRNYQITFKYLKPIYKRPIDSLALADIQPFFDRLMEEKTGKGKLNFLKIIFSYIFKYAIKYDYVEKDYSKYIKFKDSLEVKRNKVPFTNEQILELMKNDNDPIIQSILIMIFTGMRPSELLELKKENIHLEERYMIGGLKTKAGINRTIPIHEDIVKYIKNFPKLPSYYQLYLVQFNKIKDKYNFECTPHSCRHTFATLAKLNGVSEYARKKIMGHSSQDITDDVYTHAPIEYLIKEVNKIKIEG